MSGDDKVRAFRARGQDAYSAERFNPLRIGGTVERLDWSTARVSRGAIIWPEGQPEKARFCVGRVSRGWTAFWLGLLTMRRIWTLRPASADQSPTVAARLCERSLLRARA